MFEALEEKTLGEKKTNKKKNHSIILKGIRVLNCKQKRLDFSWVKKYTGKKIKNHISEPESQSPTLSPRHHVRVLLMYLPSAISSKT